MSTYLSGSPSLQGMRFRILLGMYRVEYSAGNVHPRFSSSELAQAFWADEFAAEAFGTDAADDHIGVLCTQDATDQAGTFGAEDAAVPDDAANDSEDSGTDDTSDQADADIADDSSDVSDSSSLATLSSDEAPELDHDGEGDKYLPPLGPNKVYRSGWWENSKGAKFFDWEYVDYRSDGLLPSIKEEEEEDEM